MDTTLDHLSDIELVGRAIDDAKQLARTELELAKQDLRDEAKAALRSATAMAVAFACTVLLVATLVTALAVGTEHAGIALAFAVAFLVGGAIAGEIGYKLWPREPIATMRDRVSADLEPLKEGVR